MLSPAEAVDTAMAVLVRHLSEAGCLVEPPKPAPAMTLEDAARLLCQLSRHVKLDPAEEEFGKLLRRPEMVDFAWNQSVNAGIPPADMSDAQEARRLLLAHHRRSDRT